MKIIDIDGKMHYVPYDSILTIREELGGWVVNLYAERIVIVPKNSDNNREVEKWIEAIIG